MTRSLWIASDNAKKRAELERLLAPLGYRLRGLREAGTDIEIVEDAPDFAGNAAIKARTLAQVVGGPAIGDDSGLCVDALSGAPGVRSARWAGPNATDADRIAKLLRELEPHQDKPWTARFVCYVCVAAADGEVLAGFEGICEGEIVGQGRGDQGFGYDPVFAPTLLPASSEKPTFAELGPEQKDALSHRGKALAELVLWLRSHPL